MVKYYGRARQRIGSVNTNQLGLKMSGCPSSVGRKGTIDRYISQRVSCLRGVCGGSLVNGVHWRLHALSNNHPFCAPPAVKCLAAAGGIGNINTPYYKTNAPGTKGCGVPVTGVPPGGSAPRSIVQRGVNGEILSIRVPRPLHSTYRIGYQATPKIVVPPPGAPNVLNKQCVAGSAGPQCACEYCPTAGGPLSGSSALLDELGLTLRQISITSPMCQQLFRPNCTDSGIGYPYGDMLQYIQFLFESNNSKDQIIQQFKAAEKKDKTRH